MGPTATMMAGAVPPEIFVMSSGDNVEISPSLDKVLLRGEIWFLTGLLIMSTSSTSVDFPERLKKCYLKQRYYLAGAFRLSISANALETIADYTKDYGI